jgi:hypothetical protein
MSSVKKAGEGCPSGTTQKVKNRPTMRAVFCADEAGLKQGPSTVWYGRGKKAKAEGQYRDGKRHGKWTDWHKNGMKRSESEYRDGKKHGKWIAWHVNGQKEQEGEWCDGNMHGKWTVWYQNGNKEGEGEYRNGEMHGPAIHWHESGKKRSERDYRDGERHGKWTHWNEDGSLEKEERYDTKYVSQKDVLQRYLDLENRTEPGANLFRHGQFAGPCRKSNAYIQSIPKIRDEKAALDLLKVGHSSVEQVDAQNRRATKTGKERGYLLIPRTDFSSVNHKYRKSNGGEPIIVLDDRSSQVVLTGSKLLEGEENQNWVARAIVSERGLNEVEGLVPGSVNIDNKIYFVGHKIHEPKVRQSRTVTVTLFFKLKAGLARSWKVYVHAEQNRHNRVTVEHWVLNQTQNQKTCVGCFKTNHWMVGDIVADTFEIKVPPGHPSGRYSVNFGFFDPNAKQRLQMMDSKPPIRINNHRAGPVGSFLVE